MGNKKLIIAICFFILIIGLTGSGYFFPGSLNWGFHFLGFLPPIFFFCYLIVSLAIIAYSFWGDIENRFSSLGSILFQRPIISIAAILLFFIIFAFTFRQRVPLLGDSFVLVNNYLNTLGGMHDLVVYREPLAIYFFYFVANLLRTYSYPIIMNAFLVGECILGIGFILNVIFIVKCFLTDPKARVLSILLLLGGSYMQLFYGYTEIYSVVLFFISLYIVVVAFWIRKKISFYYIPIVFMFQFFTHFLTLLLFPSFLVIVYKEYKTNGLKNIIIGFAIPCVVVILLLIALNFDLHRFIPPLSHSPFLSVTTSTDDFQAYTLFSIYHLTDLSSLWVLLGSSSVILLGLVYFFERRNFFDSIQAKFLIACVIPILIFIALAKFDLGMPTDWDVVSPYFFIITLFALVVFLNMQSMEKVRILFLCTAFTFLHCMLWVTVNASETPTVIRTKLLGDERIISQRGFYQHTYDLERYYFYRGDLSSIFTLWEQYVDRYPDDETGYGKLTYFLVMNGEGTSEKTMSLFKRWLTVNPDNVQAKTELAKIYVNKGNAPFKEGNYKEAERYNKLANALDPRNVVACNNLGGLCMKNGNIDSAIQWYSKAIQIDSAYASPYENLGLAYIQRGDTGAAVAIVNKLINLNPTAPNGYEILAKFYYKMGNSSSSIENLRIAARLGSSFAQNLLTDQKIAW